MKRDWFIFYKSFLPVMKHLNKEQIWETLLAIVEYWLEWKKPKISWIPLSIFEMVKPQIDANNKRFSDWCKGGVHWIKGKEYGKLGWRPPLKNNPPQPPKNNPPQNPPKEKEKELIDKSIKIIDKSIIKIEEENKSDKDINKMQDYIKDVVRRLWLWYKAWPQERNRIKNILTWKDYWYLCEQQWMTRHEFLANIFQVSTKLDWYNWKLYNAETFYKHYVPVYNEMKKMSRGTTTI